MARAADCRSACPRFKSGRPDFADNGVQDYIIEEYKQAIILRTDLDISEGKAIAQGAHASVFALDAASEDAYKEWRPTATKITLAAKDEAQLRSLREDAEERDLPTSLVSDQGRTELETNTVTALAVGPAPASEVDAVSGNLSLY